MSLGLLAYRDKRLNEADDALARSHCRTHREAPNCSPTTPAILRSLGRLADAEAAARAALELDPEPCRRPQQSRQRPA